MNWPADMKGSGGKLADPHIGQNILANTETCLFQESLM